MTARKVAGVQMDIRIGEKEANLAAMKQHLSEAVAEGAWLTIFPECATTGYCFESLDEARQFAEPIEGESFAQMKSICCDLSTTVVYGFIESDGDRIYNSLAVVNGDGLCGSYRKIHLPMLGLDRFTTPGDQGFTVVEIDGVGIGLNICYDSSFPEAARALMLGGADLIVLPTNWPTSSGLTADIVPQARAMENHIFYFAVNRIGHERGFEFVGKSRCCGPTGKNIAFADHRDHQIIYAEIEPAVARNKHLVNVPGQHETDRLNDRRPDQYHALVAEKTASIFHETGSRQ